jgi:PRTRC genetic system protein C
MEAHPLNRYFEVHGVKLPDPNPALSLEEVRTLYSQRYPEIATATVTGPEQVGDKLVYRFSTHIGTKG